ncbi:MAG: PaaI family thioesterase [Chitinophagaceae bacterium]|nr:PaaI family thioesterase [Chitinophagaceae bacterium]
MIFDTFELIKKYEGKKFDNSLSQAGLWLKYKLEKVEKGYVEVSMQVRQEMGNPMKQLHGGMMSMLIDEISGLSFYTLNKGTFYTTVNLHVDFLYSVAVGDTIFAKAKVLRAGKKIANVECSVYNQKNELLAHSTSNLVNTEKEIFNLIDIPNEL